MSIITTKNAGLVLVVAVALEAVIELYFHRGGLAVHSSNTKYFKWDYYSARGLFRSEIRRLKGELHSIPMAVEDLDLTIDVGVFRRSSKKMLIHISGTHGVEGFAGSAVQNAVLEQSNMTSNDDDLPTLVFVHALNPYGMANLRRWNENGVDLNRNFLTEKQFQQRLAMDQNQFGYEDIYPEINPPHTLHWTDFFWIRTAIFILRFGYMPLKLAIITGNYHFPHSLFYGGQQLQPSHVAISQFLKTHFDLKRVEALAVLDIHTGLGPSGFDTLVLEGTTTHDDAIRIFGKEMEHHLVRVKGQNQGALNCYEHVAGGVPNGIVSLFPSTLPKALPLTLEYGTIPILFVYKALRAEGASFRDGTSNRVQDAQNLRDAFYLHRNSKWQDQVVTRGVVLTEQLFHWLDKNNT